VSYDNIFWIAGGRPKPGGFRSLRPFMAGVRAGYLIGTAAGEIAADLGDLAPLREVGTLDAALREASAAAREAAATDDAAVVLLAPACASFDQFNDFEARGEAFRTLATAEAAAACCSGGGLA
jgi:UDP-N-acetylmuramoylalanine--D-glutamate ligase